MQMKGIWSLCNLNMPLKNQSPAKLVVGLDSFVGRVLISHLKHAGMKVIGSTRRPTYVDESNVYLDLTENVGQWRPPCAVDVAVICAGITKLGACGNDPVSTAHINISSVSTLVWWKIWFPKGYS